MATKLKSGFVTFKVVKMSEPPLKRFNRYAMMKKYDISRLEEFFYVSNEHPYYGIDLRHLNTEKQRKLMFEHFHTNYRNVPEYSFYRDPTKVYKKLHEKFIMANLEHDQRQLEYVAASKIQWYVRTFLLKSNPGSPKYI